MANIKSSAKSARQTVTRTAHNRSIKSGVKTALKKFQTAVSTGADTSAAFNFAASELDRAAKRRVIHKNAAARHKSRMALQLKAAKTEA